MYAIEHIIDRIIRKINLTGENSGIGQIIPVAHNLEFDLQFLNKTFPELRKAFSHHRRDSMRLALAVNDIVHRESGEERFASVSLRALREFFGIFGKQSHEALNDARDTAIIYRKLTELLMEK